MARLSLLDKEELPPALAKQVERATTPEDAAVFQVLGHRAEMFDTYHQFYFPTHNGGVVSPVIKELARLRVAQLNNCFT